MRRRRRKDHAKKESDVTLLHALDYTDLKKRLHRFLEKGYLENRSQ
jgi:hypothetical protein